MRKHLVKRQQDQIICTLNVMSIKIFLFRAERHSQIYIEFKNPLNIQNISEREEKIHISC